MNVSKIIKETLNERLGALSILPSDAFHAITFVLQKYRGKSFMTNRSEVEEVQYSDPKQLFDKIKKYISKGKKVACVIGRAKNDGIWAYIIENDVGVDSFKKTAKLGFLHRASMGSWVGVTDRAAYQEFEWTITRDGVAWIVFADMGLPGLQQARKDKRETAPLRSIGDRHVIKITSGMSAKAIESVIRHVSEVGNQVMIGNTKYESRQMADSVNKIFYSALIDNNLTVEVCHMISDGPKRNVMLMLDFVDMTFFVK